MLLILLGSCGQIADKSSNQDNQTEESIQAKADKLDNAIIQSIKDYYQIEFGKEGKLEESENDTAIELVYREIEDNYFLMSATIPLTKNQELFGWIPILEGDLNNDKKNDIVISVHIEFGNIEYQDIFVFINENEKYKLVNVTNERDVCGCSGYFRARKIENNLIIGESSCYGELDAKCCPSLNYETKVALENNTLKYLSKKKIK